MQIKKPRKLRGLGLYLGWESNPHFRRNWILNPARLPIPPPRLRGVKMDCKSKLFQFTAHKKG